MAVPETGLVLVFALSPGELGVVLPAVSTGPVTCPPSSAVSMPSSVEVGSGSTMADIVSNPEPATISHPRSEPETDVDASMIFVRVEDVDTMVGTLEIVKYSPFPNGSMTVVEKKDS